MKKLFTRTPLLTLLLGVILIPGAIWAINSLNEGWRVVNGAGATVIDVHSDCQVVNNTSGKDVFVPTKTDPEWQAFQSNPPTSVTASACATYTTYTLNTSYIYDTGSNLATAVYSAQPAIIGSYIYLFGGWGTSGVVSTIQRAPISNPRSWSNVGNLPDPLAASQLAIVGDYIYLFGGNHGTGYSRKIYRAPVSSPTSWSDTGSTLPAELCYSQLAIIGDTIYLFGGYKSGTKNYIYSAPTSNPLSWSSVGSLAGVQSHSSLAIIGDYVYLFGGYGTNDNYIQRAHVDTPTSWSFGGTLPANIGASKVAVIGDYLYLTGGYNGSDYDNNVFRAPISDPTDWTNLGGLLPGSALGHVNRVVVGNYLYLFGGYNGSGVSNNVVRASISSSSKQGATPPDVTTYNDSWKVKANE